MKARHLAPALVCVASLYTLPAAAGPNQAGVAPPGGFVSACATDLTAGGGYVPGGDLLAAFSANPERTHCEGRYFAGTAGAAAAAGYAAGTVQTQSTVTATMGAVGLTASSQGPSMSWFPAGVAGGGWSDQMVVDLAGHTGEAAIWRYTMRVSGSMASAGYAGATVMLNGFKDRVELMNDVAGFDIGNSDLFATDRQRVAWGVHYNVGRLVNDVVTFAVPVTLGQSFVWGVYALANAGVGYATIEGASQSGLDFGGGGLQYGGSAGLYIGGVSMDGYTLQAASGIDWTQAAAVPEPGIWTLMLAGLAAVGCVARKRRA